MRKVLPVCRHLFLHSLPRPLLTLAVYALIVCAYAYSAWLADFADTEVGPPVVQEALRAFIAVQIARAFWIRWGDFTVSQRALWACVAFGMALNLARTHFSATPLTLSFALVHIGLTGLTWRLMAASRREVRLARENERLRTELQGEIARRRLAEADLARLKEAHDHP